MMKKFLTMVLTLVISLVMFASEKTIKIATVGIFPMNEMVKIAKSNLEKEGYKVEIKEFSDYKTPNIALNTNEVDVNFIQHKPYMNFFKSKGFTNLAYIEPVYNVYMGFYSKDSKKYNGDINNLPNNAVVFLSADPVNKSWGLEILEENGLIKLNKGKDLYTEKDIVSNFKNLQFKFLPPSSLFKAYQEADLLFNWPSGMLKLGVTPDMAMIKVKDKKDLHAISVVAREDNKNSQKIKDFTKAIKSKEVKKFLNEKYNKEGYPVF